MGELDTKEFDVPETVFSRDIETRVIQVIILQALLSIKGVGLLEGNLIDTLFGREVERIKGIYVEQDPKNHSVNVKVEIKIDYGIVIPEKAEEVQSRIVEGITKLTGLHVSSVHVIVKSLVLPTPKECETEEEYSTLLMEAEDANA